MGSPLELFDDSRATPGHAPWAYYDADSTTEVLIEKWNALVEIDIPLAFTANHDFLRTDGVRWTGIGADLATAAKVIDVVSDPGRWH